MIELQVTLSVSQLAEVILSLQKAFKKLKLSAAAQTLGTGLWVWDVFLESHTLAERASGISDLRVGGGDTVCTRLGSRSGLFFFFSLLGKWERKRRKKKPFPLSFHQRRKEHGFLQGSRGGERSRERSEKIIKEPRSVKRYTWKDDYSNS